MKNIKKKNKHFVLKIYMDTIIEEWGFRKLIWCGIGRCTKIPLYILLSLKIPINVISVIGR